MCQTRICRRNLSPSLPDPLPPVASSTAPSYKQNILIDIYMYECLVNAHCLEDTIVSSLGIWGPVEWVGDQLKQDMTHLT